jgi:hypothetical protein
VDYDNKLNCLKSTEATKAVGEGQAVGVLEVTGQGKGVVTRVQSDARPRRIFKSSKTCSSRLVSDALSYWEVERAKREGEGGRENGEGTHMPQRPRPRLLASKLEFDRDVADTVFHDTARP